MHSNDILKISKYLISFNFMQWAYHTIFNCKILKKT